MSRPYEHESLVQPELNPTREQLQEIHAPARALEVAGGQFDPVPRPEVVMALEARALAQARVDLIQAEQIEALERGMELMNQRESLSKSLIGALHKSLPAFERQSRQNPGSEYEMFQKANLRLDLSARGRIEQVIRGFADEPSQTIESVRAQVLQIAETVIAYCEDSNEQLTTDFVQKSITAEAKALFREALRALRLMDWDYAAANLSLMLKRLWRKQQLRKSGSTEQEQRAFSHALHDSIRTIPGVGLDAAMPTLRPELRRKQYAIGAAEILLRLRQRLLDQAKNKYKQNPSMIQDLQEQGEERYRQKLERATHRLSSADQRQAETFWARERVVSHLFWLISTGEVQPINDFVGYLRRIAVEARAEEAGTTLAAMNPVADLEQVVQELTVAQGEVNRCGSFTVAELDHLYSLSPKGLDGETLKLAALDPRRQAEAGWYQSWTMALEREISELLSTRQLAEPQIQQLFAVAAVRDRPRQIKLALREIIPTLNSRCEQLLLWHGRLQQLRKTAQDDEATDFTQTAAEYLETNADAAKAFDVHILSTLGRRYNVPVASQLHRLTEERRQSPVSPTVRPRSVRKNGSTTPPSPTEAVGGEKQPHLKGLVGIVYSKRLNPISKPQQETQKFQRKFDENSLPVLSFDPETQYTSTQWEEAVLEHIQNYLGASRLVTNIDANEIAANMFGHLRGAREREMYGYADGAYAIHLDRGENGHLYVVVRSVQLEQGKLIVWMLSTVKKEWERTKRAPTK